MKAGDILLKKWCFGMGRAKARDMIGENSSGEAVTYITYPKYRTIAVKVESAVKKGKFWHVKGKQYVSLTGKPKDVTTVLEEKKRKERSYFLVASQKRPFHLLSGQEQDEFESGIPPVGSLINVDKKHALVVEVNRNELTIYVNNKYQKLAVKPGSIRWHSDKILKSIGRG